MFVQLIKFFLFHHQPTRVCSTAKKNSDSPKNIFLLFFNPFRFFFLSLSLSCPKNKKNLSKNKQQRRNWMTSFVSFEWTEIFNLFSSLFENFDEESRLASNSMRCTLSVDEQWESKSGSLRFSVYFYFISFHNIYFLFYF